MDPNVHPQHIEGLKQFVNVSEIHFMWVWSLYHFFIVSFEAKVWCRVSADFPKTSSPAGVDVMAMMSPSSSSGAYNNDLILVVYVWSQCEKRSMWVWSLYHFFIVSFEAKNLESCSLSVDVMAWWWIPLSIHSILMISNSLYICLETIWGAFHVGLEPLPLNHHGIIRGKGVMQDISTIPESWILLTKCGCNGMMMDPNVHPQHIKDLKQLVYMSRNYMRCISCGFGASSTT